MKYYRKPKFPYTNIGKTLNQSEKAKHKKGRKTKLLNNAEFLSVPVITLSITCQNQLKIEFAPVCLVSSKRNLILRYPVTPYYRTIQFLRIMQ